MNSIQRCFSLVLAASCFACTPAPVTPVAPAAVTPTADSPAVVPSTGTPAAPDAPAAAVWDLAGKAMSFDGPFTGGTVTLHVLGSEDVLASSAIAADGTYALNVPASVATGSLLELRATQDKQILAALVNWNPAKPYRLAQTGPSLDPANTAAFVIMKVRLFAIGRLMTKRPKPEVIAAALASYESIRATMQTILTKATAVTQQAVLSGMQNEAIAAEFQTAIKQIAAVTDLQKIVDAQAPMMAAIKSNVSPTDLRADSGLTSNQNVAGLNSPGIRTGSGGGSSAPEGVASGSLDITEGGLIDDETASTTITLSDPPASSTF